MLGHAACAAIESLLPPGTGIEYTGAIVSGATLAGWREAAVTSTVASATTLRSEVLPIKLPLAPQMTIDEIQSEFDSAEATTEAARQEVCTANASELEGVCTFAAPFLSWLRLWLWLWLWL